MTTIIGIRFKPNGKLYYFDPNGLTVAPGTDVIVDTARGMEYARCDQGNTDVADNEVVQPLRSILRVATADDREQQEQNLRAMDRAFVICKEKVEQHKLQMNLVSAECTFDVSKILFYFTADGRIDFRDLVRDLAGQFRTRIELRQIGVRDEAKMIGGLGACGRELCCSLYMNDFHPVSINMAKDQNLSLNPAKISGTCGRLMCCLKYEHEAYAALQKVTPRNGSIVDTPEGRGRVISTQMLRGICKVQLDDSPDHTLTEIACADCVRVIGGRRAEELKGETKPERSEERPPRRERREKPAERTEKPQKTERAPRPERTEAPERPAKPERAPRPPRADKPALPVAEEGADNAEAEKKRRRRRGGRRRSSGGATGCADAPRGESNSTQIQN